MEFTFITEIKRCIVKRVHLSVRLSENEVCFATIIDFSSSTDDFNPVFVSQLIIQTEKIKNFIFWLTFQTA